MGAARILIAEDELIIALDLERTLTRLGFDVAGIAGNGEEAVEKAGRLIPDLILMDILFRGGIDGIDAATEIRRRHDIPVIYLTANADTATVERARRSEPFGYLNKPINERDLYSNIDTALYKHRMEKRLKEGRERYQSLVEGINDVIYATDEEGLITYMSPPVKTLTGYAPDEIVGRHFIEFVHPDDSERIRRHFDAIRAGDTEPSEYRVLSKSGQIAWVRTSSRPLMVEGRFEGLRGILTDITGRKMGEHLLVLQRDLAIGLGTCRNLEEAMNLVLDTAMGIEYVDSGGIYTMEEVSGEINLIVHRGLSEDFVAHCTHYGPETPQVMQVSRGIPMHVTHREIQAGKDSFRIREGIRTLSVIPVSHEGKVIAVLNLASHRVNEFPSFTKNAIETIAAQTGSVLAVLRAEQALVQKTEELNRFFDLALDLLCIADTAGNFRRLNRQWEKTLGYPLEELEGRRFLDFVHPDDLESTVTALSELSAQNRVLDFENRYRRRDGDYLWIEWRSIPSGDLIYAAARDVTARRDYQEELERRERQLAFLAENMLDIIGQLDREFRFTYLSASIQRVTGYEPEDLQGTRFTDYIHPEDIERTRNEIKRAVESRHTAVRVCFRFRRHDGDYIWLESETRILYDGTGALAGLIFSTRDVTDRMQMEEELMQLIRIIETTSDLVATASLDRRVRYINRPGRRLLGWDDGEPVAGKTLESAHPAWAAEIVTGTGIPAAMSDGIWTGETALLRSDGTEIPVSQTVMVHRSQSGAVEFISTIMRDIREIKTAQLSLQESESRFRKIFESSMDGIAVSHRGIITMANPAFVRMFGYDSAAEMVSRSHDFLMPPTQREIIRELLAQRLSGGHVPSEYEARVLKRDGAEFDVDVRVSTYTQNDQIFALAIVRDITERKRDERALKESVREKEALLKEIHHRVKNNFQLVSSMMNLQAVKSGEGPVRDELEIVGRRIHTMAQLHETLYQSQDLHSIEITGYLKRIVAGLYPPESDATIRLEMEEVSMNISQALPCGLIVNELVSNSLRHAFPPAFRGDKIVTVSLHGGGVGRITLGVSDSGVGMKGLAQDAPEQSLGLTLVKALARQLKGTLTADTVGGTSVFVEFTMTD
ncbi:MAG: PAS domain S-box protein [Spirochaetes bacterium]|nr:PAS domain S-box protein [Spirochaetota bacterium]